MTLYEVLGVARDASQEDIEKAYRRAAHKSHPDREGGDKEEFQRVEEAGRILRDPEARKRYDETGLTAAAPDPETIVRNNLRAIFMGAIDNVDPDCTDLVELVRDSIIDAKKMVHAHLRDTREALAKRERAAKRILKTGENIFVDALQASIDQHKKSIGKLEAELPVMDSMLRVLSEYGYKFDRAAPRRAEQHGLDSLEQLTDAFRHFQERPRRQF